jgi:hypothetical protein
MAGNVLTAVNATHFVASAIRTSDKKSVTSLLNVNLSIVYIDALESKSPSLKSCTVHRQLRCIDAP